MLAVLLFREIHENYASNDVIMPKIVVAQSNESLAPTLRRNCTFEFCCFYFFLMSFLLMLTYIF